MPPININWSDLEIAFERNSPDQESFLDLENGDLLAYPAERERWFAYRSDLLHFHIQTWLEHMQIQVANTPPWGRVEPPEEPPELPRPIPSGEAPGEILRRQARELLDEIPAAELPSALVFLEFLRDRGTGPLLSGFQRQDGNEAAKRQTLEALPPEPAVLR